VARISREGECLGGRQDPSSQIENATWGAETSFTTNLDGGKNEDARRRRSTVFQNNMTRAEFTENHSFYGKERGAWKESKESLFYDRRGQRLRKEGMEAKSIIECPAGLSSRKKTCRYLSQMIGE